MRYRKPEVRNLDSFTIANGLCTTGTSVGNQCFPGIANGTACNPGSGVLIQPESCSRGDFAGSCTLGFAAK